MTTEKWLPVLGYETSYEVSNLGRVRSIDKHCSIRGGGIRLRKGRILKPKIHYGYLIVNLSHKNKQKSCRVARLVLAAFEGDEPTLEARHLNGDKLCNHLTNLAWGRRKENEADKKLHGTYQLGIKNPNNKLDETVVLTIRKRLANGELNKDLAKEYGVSTSTITAIKTRITWSHL